MYKNFVDYSGNALLSWFSTLVVGCGIFLYPTITMVGLNIALAVKLIRLSYKRKQLTRYILANNS